MIPVDRRFQFGWMLAAFVVPQALLLVLNWDSWTLVAGEANAAEKHLAMWLGVFALLLWLTNVALTVCVRLWQPGVWVALLSLLAHVGYMWTIWLNINDAIPSSVQPWILREAQVGRYNITLTMPAAFVSLWVVVRALGRDRLSPWALISSATVLIAVPLVWFVLITFMQPAWLGQGGTLLGIAIGTVLVVLFLGTVIHLVNRGLYDWFISEEPRAYYVIAGLVGVVMPFAGLALNRSVPFPTDLQSMSIYALTGINALVLLLRVNVPAASGWVLFCRCVMFPFIAYFFLVFLPFLPLSVLAILFVGLGVLMLTPLMLGIFQARVTWQSFLDARDHHGRAVATTIAIAGLLVLPGYFALEAWRDRVVLQQTLDHFYAHDYDQSAVLSQPQADRAARVLLSLRDRKTGIQLPFLSRFYNQVVFGEMVLPDTKIKRTYRLLTGTGVPPAFSLFSSPSQRRWGRFEAPQTAVDVETRTLETLAPGRLRLNLTLRNTTQNTHTLYRDTFTLPAGVFVSGLQLKIGGEWVDGRLFDRKTALWVFEKITERRRDPALLHYLSEDTVELRIYPFPANGVREVQIDFLTHPSMVGQLTAIEHAIALRSAGNLVFGADGRSADIGQYAGKRTPYLHVILDGSNHQRRAASVRAEDIQQLAEQLGITAYRMQAADLSSGTVAALRPLPTTLSELAAAIEVIDAAQNPSVGGLWAERALIEAMRNNAENPDVDHFPVFVVVSDDLAIREDLQDLDLSPYAMLNPDTSSWYSLIGDSQDVFNIRSTVPNAEQEVVVLRAGDEIQVLANSPSQVVGGWSGEDLEVYDRALGDFVLLAMRDWTFPASDWQQAADAWVQRRQVGFNPALVEQGRRDWLRQARELRVLLPGTAFIVVEAPSQWEILRRKEQQALNSHGGLEFEDEQQTSEPLGWLLLLIFLVWLARRDREVLRG